MQDKTSNWNSLEVLASGQDLSPEIIAHMSMATHSAEKNLEKVRLTASAEVDALNDQLVELATPRIAASSKLMRSRFLAGEWSYVFAPKTACASGCSHCCHIRVSVSRSEAKLIAKAIGRKVAKTESTTPITLESAKA